MVEEVHRSGFWGRTWPRPKLVKSRILLISPWLAVRGTNVAFPTSPYYVISVCGWTTSESEHKTGRTRNGDRTTLDRKQFADTRYTDAHKRIQLKLPASVHTLSTHGLLKKTPIATARLMSQTEIKHTARTSDPSPRHGDTQLRQPSSLYL